ncbi:MAG TPA: hypothetical protein VL092_01800, partial [Chitinophagaceae bacterium]|nr:hypothetical protein [Chitinophagaceae bacterium]
TETNNGRALKFVTIRSEQDLTLSLSLPAALPNTAGTYEYRITADNPSPGEAQLKLWAGDRFFIPGNNGATKILLNLDSTGTVTKVYLPDIEVSTEVAPVLYRILGVNYNK